MTDNYIDKIALIGGGGQIGKHILQALVAAKKQVTLLTRDASRIKPQSNVTVKGVDYDNQDSLIAALQGCQAVVITLAVSAPKDTQTKIVKAAAKAGIHYIMPNQWGIDTLGHEAMRKDIYGDWANPMAIIHEIEELGMTWMALTSGNWYEFSLNGGPERWGFDFPRKSVIMFGDGNIKINVSTWELSAQTVAKLFSLPMSSGSSLSLEDFKNKLVYVSSFYVSQRDMLDSVQRVTNTTDKDWTITYQPVQERFDEGVKMLNQGNFMGFAIKLYIRTFYDDGAGDYEQRLDNKRLGVKEERTLDECTKRALDSDIMGQIYHTMKKE